MKRAIVESGREICGLVRVGGWNPKSVWWNDQVKVAVKRKKALGARNDVQMSTKRKIERLKGAFIKVRRRSKNNLEGK